MSRGLRTGRLWTVSRLAVARLLPSLALTLLIVAWSGCLRHQVKLPELKGLRPANASEYAQFIERWKTSQTAVQTGRILSRALVSGGVGRSTRLKQVTIFSRPDRFRQQFFATNLNAPTFIVLVRGADFEAFDFQSRRGFRGPVTLENARKLLTVPLYPEEWSAWLCGRFIAPPADETISDELKLDEAAGVYLYRVALGDGRVFKAYLNQSSLLLSALEVGYLTQDDPVFVSTYSYGETRGYPSIIAFELPEENISGQVEIEQSIFNRPFSESESRTLFSPPFPSGAEFISLEDLPPDYSVTLDR